MIREILKRPAAKQLIRFVLIGLESSVLTYLIFIIFMHFLHVNYTVSFMLGFIAGIFFGFTFNKIWTFESKRNFEKEIWIYFIVYFISLGVGTLMIRFLVESFNINPLVANLPTIGVTTVINFLGTKVLAFRNKKW
jgi:putative flippase GtrA